MERFDDSMLPCDFFRSIRVGGVVGLDNMMRGLDYPRSGLTFPRSRKMVAEILAGVPGGK